MPRIYRKMGLSFQYPDNWTLDEDEAMAGNASVTVYSPNTAFWSVTLHPRGASPQSVAQAVVQAMRAEYEQLDAEAASEELVGRQLEGYDLNFYCLDLTNTCLVRCLDTEEGTLLVMCQAEDREFDQVAPVFRAMTASLLGAKAPAR